MFMNQCYLYIREIITFVKICNQNIYNIFYFTIIQLPSIYIWLHPREGHDLLQYVIYSKYFPIVFACRYVLLQGCNLLEQSNLKYNHYQSILLTTKFFVFIFTLVVECNIALNRSFLKEGKVCMEIL